MGKFYDPGPLHERSNSWLLVLMLVMGFAAGFIFRAVTTQRDHVATDAAAAAEACCEGQRLREVELDACLARLENR